MGRQQAASCLKVTVYTVDDHRDVILRRCREIWGEEHDGDFDLYFLRGRFWPFLRGLEEV